MSLGFILVPQLPQYYFVALLILYTILLFIMRRHCLRALVVWTFGILLIILAWGIDWPGGNIFPLALSFLGFGSPTYPTPSFSDSTSITLVRLMLLGLGSVSCCRSLRHLRLAGHFEAHSVAPKCPRPICGGRILPSQTKCAECGLSVRIERLIVAVPDGMEENSLAP